MMYKNILPFDNKGGTINCLTYYYKTYADKNLYDFGSKVNVIRVRGYENDELCLKILVPVKQQNTCIKIGEIYSPIIRVGKNKEFIFEIDNLTNIKLLFILESDIYINKENVLGYTWSKVI